MEKTSKRILAMPVYSVQEGQHLGFVKGLVIDPAQRAIAAIVIERRRMSREERIISFQNIASIGDDAITIAKANTAERKSNMPTLINLMRNPVHLLGARVLTVGGKTLGKIEEYRFDNESGKLTHLELSGGGNLFKEKIVINADHIITIAQNTLMIADAALDELEPIENGLFSGMGAAKEKASNAMNATVNATIEASKKLSQNISNSINKLKTETLPKEEAPPEEVSPEETQTEEKTAEEATHDTEVVNPGPGYPSPEDIRQGERPSDPGPDALFDEEREQGLPITPSPPVYPQEPLIDDEEPDETGERRYRPRRHEE